MEGVQKKEEGEQIITSCLKASSWNVEDIIGFLFTVTIFLTQWSANIQ